MCRSGTSTLALRERSPTKPIGAGQAVDSAVVQCQQQFFAWNSVERGGRSKQTDAIGYGAGASLVEVIQ